MILTKESFECVNEANSEEEDKRQWAKSQIVFDEFEEYLNLKGYNDITIQSNLEYSSYFMMNYFFVHEDELSVLETDDTTIRKFLGNWYIRENGSPTFKEMNEILTAILDFFEFVLIGDFITVEQFENIEQVCTEKEWFENRLKKYNNTNPQSFKKWMDQYNYEW